jgi:hypothetical protein
MKSWFRLVLTLGASLALLPAVAAAQPYDHLKCYKFRDVQLFDSAQADIEALQVQFGLQNCSIKKKAKQFCVPASKTVTQIVNGADMPFVAQALVYDQICYKITCPNVTIPDQQISDQFGTRTGSRFKASMLCVPAVLGLPPTTTTTTTVTTTTTTVTTTLPSTPFSVSFGDTGDDIGARVTTDSADNIIATGWFSGTVDFGTGPIASAGGEDVYVLKLAPSGAPIWVQTFGDLTDDNGLDVAVDSGDNVVVGGSMSGTVDFGGGPLMSSGGNDAFVVKLSPSGSHVWSAIYGGAADDRVLSVAVNSLDATFIQGDFSSASIDFGGGPLGNSGMADSFLAKLSPVGAHQWSQVYGGTGTDLLFGLAIDPTDNVLITGAFSNTVSYGGAPLVSSGTFDIVAAKYDTNGMHAWSKRFGDAAPQLSTGVAADSTGNVILTGQVAGSADFGGGPLVSAGGTDAVIAKLDPSGTHLWSQIRGDGVNQNAFEIAVDGAGNLVVSGSFNGSIDFGGGPMTSAGGSDVFLAKLSSGGAFISNLQAGDTVDQTANGVAVDGANNRILTGNFNGTIDFGLGPMTSTGLSDAFIVKLAP